MNGRERIIKTFEHAITDRVPWVPYTGVQISNLMGYNAEEILKNEDKLVDCLLEAHRRYTPDGMPVIFDLQLEAEILGCDLLWAEKNPPTVSSHPLAESRDIPTKIPESHEGRLPLILNAMKRMKKEVGDTTALYGLLCGPMTLASHLRGTELFLDMYDDENYVKDLLHYCTDVASHIAEYYCDAGMDVIAAVDPVVSQISPDMFSKFLQAPYRNFFAEVRDRGRHSAFFVCGDATKNLEAMCKTEPHCISIDENIDIHTAKGVTDAHNIVISGNLQLTIVMLLGNQMDNQKAALDLLDSMGKKNFILAPGCDIPYDVPPENIIGVSQVVHDMAATRAYLQGYVKDEVLTDVILPDYQNLDHVLIEVITIDSETCAACRYMTSAAMDMKEIFNEKVEVLEHKITNPVNIARMKKLGVVNLPVLLINGEIKYVSVIPDRKSLKADTDAALGN